ncbi:TPA: hypothetical protein ACH3X3_013607 [Trebouxia sp. C0006]
MSATPTLDGADLMAFCAQEFQTFFSHMGDAIKLFKATGHLPDTVFRGAAPQAAANGDKRAKVKRKPTAFNMFVKEKMEEFKAAGVRLEDDKNGNLMFTLAVAEWKKLDEDQKQAYTRKFKADVEDQADEHEPETVPTDLALDFSPGLPADAPAASAPASPTAEVDDTNMVQKKRKIREAEAQPILPDMEGTSAQQSAPENAEKKQKKKKKDKKQAE